MVEPVLDKHRKEILNLLRWKLTDPAGRGSTATTNTLNGDGSETDWTLSNNGVKYVGDVTVDGITKYLYTDFTVDFKDGGTAGVLSFNTAPGNGEIVSIDYGHGQTWVYTDAPRTDALMPRISLQLVSGGLPFNSIGGQTNWFKPVQQIGVWVKANKTYSISGRDYTGTELRDYLGSKVQEAIIDNRSLIDGLSKVELLGMRTADFMGKHKLRVLFMDFHFLYDWRRT